MFDFENDFDYGWTESAKGFVLHEDGEILATVFSNKFQIWMIIINQDEGGRLVADEYFDNATQAIKRANSIMAGAPCKYAPEPASGVSGWVKQATVANGKPAYGKRYGGRSVSVKCAASGKWYYVTYKGSDFGKPEGWFATPEQTMKIFDSRHQ